MTNRLLLLLVPTVAALGVACGGDGDDAEPAAQAASPVAATADAPVATTDEDGTVEVVSEDGSLRLTIPDGAFPDGVTRDDVRVSVALAPDEPVAAPAADGQHSRPLAVYDLEPSGTRFLEPVAVEVTLARGAVDAPITAFHVDDAGIEALELVLAGEPTEETVVLAATVEHFSRIIYLSFGSSAFEPTRGLFKVDLTVSKTELQVGESLVATARIPSPGEFLKDVTLEPDPWIQGISENVRMPYRISLEGTQFRVAYHAFDHRGGTGAGGRLFREYAIPRNSDVLSPPFQRRGFRLPYNNVGSYEASATFTCEKPGDWEIGFHTQVWFSYNAVPVSPPEGVELPEAHGGSGVNWPSSSVSGRCLAPATPTPVVSVTSTPSTLPSPTPTSSATATATETPAASGNVAVEVLILDGQRWPADQFRVAGPDACDGDHWHATGTVYSLIGASATDPNQSGCGFGKISEVEKRTVTITAAEWQFYQDVLEANR